ncbi:MAG: Lrp/AsnC family transcriptional regulator [Desulfobacteraceae bacterium]|nr:Lrp/AsnC family transcriptional regulator [Desulfobacteraceae bacterium]
MDHTDLAILKALQINGRQKHNELARRLKIAQSTVSERVRRMESNGTIKGYKAIIGTGQLGLTVKAFISIRLGRHEKETIQMFEEQIRQIPYVQACYHLTGRYDYMLHVLAADLNELGNLVKNVISELPGFLTSETFVIFSEIKSEASIPIDEPPDQTSLS